MSDRKNFLVRNPMDVADDKGNRRGAAAILLDSDCKVITGVLQNGCHKLPQGGLSVGESPMIAIIRELYEEVGVTPYDFEVVAGLDKAFSYKLGDWSIWEGQSIHWFVIRLKKGVELDISKSGDWIEKGPEKSEFMEIKRMGIDDFLALNEGPRIKMYRRVFQSVIDNGLLETSNADTSGYVSGNDEASKLEAA